MLQFFRRIINSRVGVIVTFGVLILIAILFGLGDVTGLRGGGGRIAADNLATVGGEPITVADLRRDLDAEFQNAQAQQPGLTMAQFVAAGAVESLLEREINGAALEQFGRAQKMVVSKRAVDGQIASIPSLQGPTGQFDPKLYQVLLAQRRLTDAQVRAQIARDMISQQLLAPTVSASLVPDQFVLPYASALLEKRSGSIAFIPAAALPAGAAPTDPEAQAFYTRFRARYMVPERRVVRYALVTADTVLAAATPSDAEIAAAYKARATDFAAAEKRDVEQVTIADATAAAALAVKVKGGASLADAARAAGLEEQKLTAVTKAAYAGQTSAAVADAVFGAGQGALVGPAKGAIGYVVARVIRVTKDPGKTLEQARPELAAALTTTKTAAALLKARDALDTATSSGASFTELAARQHLTTQTSAPITAAGVDPDDPALKAALAARAANPAAPAPPAPDPKLVAVAAAAFQAEQGDRPSMAPLGQDGSFALISLDKVIPAAPRPLAEVRSQVAADLIADRREAAARAVAAQVIAKVNGGAPLTEALAATALTLPAGKPVTALRAQAVNNPQAPAALKLLFQIAPRKATLSEAPNRSGWLLIYLDSVTAGNATGNRAVLGQAAAGFRQAIGREYADQFAHAVQAQLGVVRNTAAIARLKAQLVGAGQPDQNSDQQ